LPEVLPSETQLPQKKLQQAMQDDVVDVFLASCPIATSHQDYAVAFQNCAPEVDAS
jgi:hypothetical protein